MNLVLGWCLERIPDEKREQWEADLGAALPGQEKAAPTKFTAEQEGADFMATMQSHAAMAKKV